jgi:signal transduction histidine kinase
MHAKCAGAELDGASLPNRIQDVATFREIEEALLKSHTGAAAGQFATAIMHEINNPLEAISNLAYLVQREADDPTKVREYARMLSEQLANVARIARRTLSFHRSEGTMASIDVAELAEAALRIHKPKLGAKQPKLVKDIPAGAVITGHAGEMLQVLSNLLSNAIDALPANGKLVVRVRKHHGKVHLIVADDGHGIPDAIRENIFDPFFTTKNDKGTGLGLAISKSIVERHNGTMRLRSSVREGRSGTAFRVSLPLHDAPSKVYRSRDTNS